MTTDQQRALVRKWIGSGSVNIFGAPFAGKDTQGHRLAAWLNAHVISGGDLLRNRHDLPPDIRAIMERGDLIPRKDFLGIVEPFLTQPMFEGLPLVLSAVGRYHGEEPNVWQAMEDTSHPIRAVLLLELPIEEVWVRWGLSHDSLDRGVRPDDHQTSLELRLKVFEEKTLPVLDYYKERDLLISIDGVGSPDEVENLVLAALYARALK